MSVTAEKFTVTSVELIDEKNRKSHDSVLLKG
jgi:hypothetical protein